MIALIWNCQGAAARAWYRVLKNMINKHKPDIVGLLEPRVSGTHADDICKNIGYENWIRVEAVGFSGGIWIFWKKDTQLSVIASHPQFVLTRIEPNHSPPWLFSIVYGSPNSHLRKKLWQDLRLENFDSSRPWISMGDFNSITNENEVYPKDNFANHRCAGINEWIFDQGLQDMGFMGPKYTWTRGTKQNSFSGARLDRGLCNLEWKSLFPDALITHLPILQSDHAPLLLDTRINKRQDHCHSFKFQAAWLTHPHFKDMVQREWNTKKPMETNIAHMAKVLPEWNRKEFGNILRRKNRIIARINGIQRCLNTQPTNGLLKLNIRLKKELDVVLEQEELMWFQRSREEWIKSGDRNTKFYHAATMSRKGKNKIEALKLPNGEWEVDSSRLKHMAVQYFSTLFKADNHDKETEIPTCCFPRLNESLSQDLHGEIEPSEIKIALSGMAPLKAPGPDGIHAGFYQNLWTIVEESMSKMALQFLRQVSYQRELTTHS